MKKKVTSAVSESFLCPQCLDRAGPRAALCVRACGGVSMFSDVMCKLTKVFECVCVLMLLFLDSERRRSRSGMSCKVQECLWHSTPGGRTNHWTDSGRLPFLLRQSDEAAGPHVGFCERAMCWCFKLAQCLFFATGWITQVMRGQKKRH